MADTYGDVVTLPSNTVETLVTDPEILASTAGLVQKGGTFASGNGTLAAGTVVARLTASGKFVPYGQNVNEVQTVTIDATGGTFTLTFDGETTSALAFDASAATVKTALDGLSNINPGDVTVALDALVYTITFAGQYAGENVPALVSDASSLTGGGTSATVATSTAGGNAAGTGAETAVGVLRTGIETASADTLGNIVFAGSLTYSKLTGLDAKAIEQLNGRTDTVQDLFVF